jgi:hypothetical protein
MYTEILQSIDGIGLFPVISLVLFVAFFSGLLLWIVRTKRSEFDGVAALPLDEPGGTTDRGVAGHGRVEEAL